MKLVAAVVIAMWMSTLGLGGLAAAQELDEPPQVDAHLDGSLLTVTGSCEGSFVRVDVIDSDGRFVQGGEDQITDDSYFSGSRIGAFSIVIDLDGSAPGRYRIDVTCTFPLGSNQTSTSYFSELFVDVTEDTDPGRLVVTDGEGNPLFPDSPPLQPDGPIRILGASSVRPGESLAIEGDGFESGEEVYMVVYSAPQYLGSLMADDRGAIAGAVTLPVDIEAGRHTLVAYGETRALTVEITVTAGVGTPVSAAGPAAGGALPATGGGVLGPAFGGAASLLAGVVMVAVAARSRRPAPRHLRR